MPTLVRFRFNKLTGEVEEFLVDDQDRFLPEAEHDRIATEVARFVAQNPRVESVGVAGASRSSSVASEAPEVSIEGAADALREVE